MVHWRRRNRSRRYALESVMDDKVYDEATKVDAEDGKVVLDGPDGVAVLMTPEAALETSDRLLFGASQAMGQRVQEEQRHKRPEEPPQQASQEK